MISTVKLLSVSFDSRLASESIDLNSPHDSPGSGKEDFVARELAQAGQSFLRALDIRPADETLSVYQELPQQLKEGLRCVLAVSGCRRETLKAAQRAGSFGDRQRLGQLPGRIHPRGLKDLLDISPPERRHSVRPMRDEFRVSGHRHPSRMEAEVEAGIVGRRGNHGQRLDALVPERLSGQAHPGDCPATEGAVQPSEEGHEDWAPASILSK